MKPNTKNQFIIQVMNELNVIKTNATQEEISRLDPSTFNAGVGNLCIYGQMTGSCSSRRAKEIFPKVYAGIRGVESSSNPYTFKNQNYQEGNNYTSLEKYLIMTSHSKCLEIIEYLKGNITEIRLR